MASFRPLTMLLMDSLVPFLHVLGVSSALWSSDAGFCMAGHGGVTLRCCCAPNVHLEVAADEELASHDGQLFL